MLGKAIAIFVSIILIAFIFCLGKLWEGNDISSILVVQSLSGRVTIYTDAGYKWQGWGRVTHYRKSSILNFNKQENQTPIKVRFAEGGHGDVNGSCRYDLPLGAKEMMDIHQTFGSQEGVEWQLIRPTVERSMYMTGPLMTSAESYSVRRPDLINLFEDQATKGVFQMAQTTREIDDPITGQKKWITAVSPKLDKSGVVLRQEESPLIRFGVRLYNVAIVGIDYEKIVEDQIAQQQQATIAVQIAIANSKRAEQDALTTEQQGKASAIKAKWEQETIKAKAVTLADQEKSVAETNATRDRNVADLARQAAEFTKQQQIALGQGEAERKKLAMQANGALEIKAQTWLEAQKYWANAFSNYRGNIVPNVITGSGSGAATGQGNGLETLMELIGAKTARDLALDMKMEQTKQ